MAEDEAHDLRYKLNQLGEKALAEADATGGLVAQIKEQPLQDIILTLEKDLQHQIDINQNYARLSAKLDRLS
jgi:hypothetical protein